MHKHAVIAAILGASIVLAATRPVAAQEPAAADRPQLPAASTKEAPEAIRKAVEELVAEFRRHPARPGAAPDRMAGLYMAEVATGEAVLIADPPDRETTFCGSAAWSSDGTRILFDTMRPEQVAHAHIKVIELVAGKLTMTDLGVGNCPSFAPSGEEIVFLLNHGGVPGAQGGVWSMKPDGSDRHRIGSFGRPELSPDGRRLLLDAFAIPAHVALVDVGSAARNPVQLRGLQIYSVPHWAGAGTIVAVVGSEFGDSIALIDVTNPLQAKVKETLWKMSFKGQGPDVKPCAVAYRESVGRCVFAAKGAVPGTAGLALYWFDRGPAAVPKRLERGETIDTLMQDLALSPDGRFVLFTSSRTPPRQGQPPAGAIVPATNEGSRK